MKYRYFPYLGFMDLDRNTVKNFGVYIAQHCYAKAFVFSWLNFHVLLFVKEVPHAG